MCKQIILFFLLVNQLVNAQEKINKKPVYDKLKIVGFLYNDTKLKSCEGCYVLDSLTIFDKIIIIKSEVLIIGIGESKKQFSNLYSIEKIKEGENFILVINNTMNSTSNKLYLKKIKRELFIFKQFSQSSSSTKIKIGKNDYLSYPSNYICINTVNKKVLDNILDISDLFRYEQNKECFHCPIKYSLKECLEMYNRKQQFNWD